jgi:DNA modification methylase
MGICVVGAFYSDGVVLNAKWPDCAGIVRQIGQVGLCIADPPYGNVTKEQWDQYESQDQCAKEQLANINALENVIIDQGIVYWFGGYGLPGFRPFYQLAATLENNSAFRIAAHITWGKKRA